MISAACLGACRWIEVTAVVSLPVFCGVLFVLAWVGQFIGHKIEGKKPSFFEDLQFLLVGPVWLLRFVYERMGLPV